MSRLSRLKRKTLNFVYESILGDRRCKFYDLAKLPTEARQSKSPVIQFYSSVDNIGNYTPILGIQKMLDHTPDVWCMHDRKIDFEFINSNYKCAIIGGAGLLHYCFEPFWNKFLSECKLPVIIWGVGVCFPDNEAEIKGVSKEVISAIAKRSDLVNVRDDTTANHYNLVNASISICPTIVYIQKFRDKISKSSQSVLFSWHESLTSVSERERIKEIVNSSTTKFKSTDNCQYPFIGVQDIVTNYYCKSQLVVTTRLHGAIIAYSLQIPYVAIPRDEKLREFYRLYGNGIRVDDTRELGAVIQSGGLNAIQAFDIKPVLSFGRQARDWMETYTGL